MTRQMVELKRCGLIQRGGVALLLVDTSSIPDLSEYPAVDFSYDDVRIGDVLVTLGYPHGRVGNPNIWNNLGSVT